MDHLLTAVIREGDRLSVWERPKWSTTRGPQTKRSGAPRHNLSMLNLDLRSTRFRIDTPKPLGGPSNRVTGGTVAT